MTAIEWTHKPGTKGESWNIIAGCTKCQPECKNCYALRYSWRTVHNSRHPARYDGVTEKIDGVLRWTGRVNIDWDAVEQPLHWREPRTVFVASMADLFHQDVPFKFIDAVFDVIEQTPQHTYIVLTKRSEMMLDYWRMRSESDTDPGWRWPYNCWAGASAGTQHTMEYHLPILAQLNGPAVKFISAEPLLEYVFPFDVDGNIAVRMQELQPRELRYPADVLDWIVCGFETGPGARTGNVSDARALRDHCHAAGIKFFWKRGNPGQKIPSDLLVREWPDLEQ